MSGRRILPVVFSLFVASSACLGQATRPAAPKPATWSRPAPTTEPSLPGVLVYHDLRYGPSPGVSNLLDLYVPAQATGKLPVVIWIHGGGWLAGDKRSNPLLSGAMAGFAIASINYRFSTEAPFPAQAFDCKGSIRWIRAHAGDFNLDERRIGVGGDSAGGHLAALLGTTNGERDLEGDVGGNLDRSSDVQAVCDWFGPTDFSTIKDEILKLDPKSPFVIEPTLATRLFGGSDKLDLARLASPLSHVSPTSAPFLIFHGEKDTLVPPAQSEALAEALKKQGVFVELIKVPGAGHGGAGFGTHENMLRILAFFNDKLRPAQP
jgi:acetyl esterase/lipase